VRSAVALKVFLTGPVVAESNGVVTDERRLPGRQGRLLFAYLVAEQGRAVPRDELADALWGDDPPATWDKALSVLVSKLRSVLAEHGVDGARALTGAFGCYRLQLPEGSWVDVLAAETGVHDAERELATGEVETAKASAALAESLLRQPFLPGDDGTWIDAKRRDLDDVRARALSVLVDACMKSGNPREAAKWAAQAIALEPFRESGYRRLMEAHATAGDRAEALRVYERCRRLLAEELGAYPSPETESIYRALLDTPAEAAGPATAAAPVAGDREREDAPPRRRLTPLRVGAAGVIAAIAAGVVTAVVTTGGGDAHATVAPNSVVELRPSGSIAATVAVGALPVALTSGAGSLWVANLVDRSVTRVDPSTHRAVRTISIDGAPTGLAGTKGAIWIADGTGNVSDLDPAWNRIRTAGRFAAAGSGFYGSSTPRPALAAFGSIWVVDPDGYVSRLDPATGRRVASIDVGNEPSAIAAGAGSVWVTNSADGTVTRIDPATLLTTPIPVGHGPAAIAVDERGVWIANSGDDAVVRVDPETNAVAGTTHVGSGPTALLATPAAIWVANGSDGTVMRLDSRSGRVQKKIRVGGTPDAFAAVGGQVWVAVAPAPPPAPVAGGVARFTSKDDFLSLDPALDNNPQVLYATCANLVTYPDEAAPKGSRIVPEVAEAVPAPTNGGRTYTFRIRPGFRFSPPSNEPVTAATFKSTIERIANRRMKSPVASQFTGVVGYRAYFRGKADGLSGIVARGDTLTIRLSHPDGGFLAGLADLSVCAVPPGTPADAQGIDNIPSAGPYYVASYAPGRQLVMKRNPNYQGERPHRLVEIVVAIGVDSSRALGEIEAGKADYALEGLPRDAGPRLESQYGPGSKAAKEGHQQYFISEANAARYMHMNTSRPLFSSVRLRRAVNYAIDRAALVAQGRRFAETNPFNAGKPTDDYLPPSMAGARDFHLYPLNRAELRRAKQLAGRVHATAIMYTPNVPPWLQEAQIVRLDLKPLGIDVQVKEMPLDDFYARIVRPAEPYDLAVSGWYFGSDPISALAIFTGHRTSTQSGPNFSHLADAAFNRKLAAAERLSGTARYRAAERLSLELERDLAPAAAFSINASRDFFSARTGCQVYQPFFGIDLAALCLRR
jgi:ABC-type transport system substrate-binding protein/DNA-binding SARP family transcriptional activator